MKNLLFSLTLVLALGLTACQSGNDADVNAADTMAVATDSAALGNTITDFIAADPQFSTLTRALQATGLDQSLQGAGPFTLFAPTDAAFAKLGAQVDTLLLDKNRQQLTEILLHHVVADAELMASNLSGMTTVTTMQGSDLAVTSTDGSVMLNSSASVTATDFDASNGTIHVVDTVLLPTAADSTAL